MVGAMTDTADALAPRIPPPINDVTRPFWTGGANGELLIQHCDDCEKWVHPPSDKCPGCGGSLDARPVSGSGTVFTFTINRHQYHPAVPPPYVVAIVELAEQPGLRFTTNIVNCDLEAIGIGMPVHVLFEQAGEAWVPVFEPD
jgi:uncharacterized OB-fold protein